MIDRSMFSVDKSGMYAKLLSFHEQLTNGLAIGQKARIDKLKGHEFRSILFAGMGGSAIAGDLAAGILEDELNIPISLRRDYGLPGWVGDGAIVICSSYSGNTEETLSVFDEAVKRGLPIVCITTGGALERRAAENGLPIIKLPTGFMPREALGYSLTPLLVLFNRLGLCADHSDEVKQTSIKLKSIAENIESGKDNAIYEMAAKLTGRVAVIYSGGGLAGSLGLRFKCQICENAKQIAFCNIFPEFNHNELVGWELSSKHDDKLTAVILNDENSSKELKIRVSAVKGIFEENNVATLEFNMIGDSRIEKAFSTIARLDFVSYFLALINKVDPTPIKLIDFLKDRMSQVKEKS